MNGNHILSGWMIFFRGWGVCQRYKGLWWLVLACVLVNLIVFGLLFYLGAHFLSDRIFALFQAFVKDIPAFFRYVFMGFFIYVFYLLMMFFINTIGMYLNGFFYTLLASKVAHRVQRDHGVTLTTETPRFGLVLKYESQKFLILMGLGIVITALGWLIPFAGWLLWGALVLMIAYAYFDYGFVGLNMPFSQRFRWVRSRFWPYFSAGLVIYFILAIPLIGFMLCPICVVGTTDLVLTDLLDNRGA